MTKTEMIELLRGKVINASVDEIQSMLNEIADWIEQHDVAVENDKRYNE